MMMKQSTRQLGAGLFGARALVSALALACATHAMAADTEPQAEPLPLWEVGAGVGSLVAPAYLGSKTIRSYVSPWPYAVYRGDRLHANKEGVGLGLIRNDRLKLDLSVSGALPVSSEGTAREGMRDLPLVGEVGPVLRYRLINETGQYVGVQVPLRYGFGVRKQGLEGVGWISDPTLRIIESITLLGKRMDWGTDLSVKFQDRRFNNFYYGVRPFEATAERSAYTSEGGYSGVTVNTGLLARWDKWVVGGFVGATELAGARFVNSPLMETKTNFYGGVAVFWIFDKSSSEGRSSIDLH